MLAHGPDIVGLQEWGVARRSILRRHPRYDWAAPSYGVNAVGFDRERFTRLGHRLHLVGHIGVADRGARPVRLLPPRVVTLVRLRDGTTGRPISVIDYHLVPGSQARGVYRGDRPLLAARHQSEARRLGALVTQRIKAGGDVVALGDSNFDGFQVPGLTSAWEGRRDDPVGTLGSSRKIDDVFAMGPAIGVMLVRTASDHAAVLVQRPE